MCLLNEAVEMTTNQIQQHISIKLADDYLSTLLTGNVMKFPVDLTKIFNRECLQLSAMNIFIDFTNLQLMFVPLF